MIVQIDTIQFDGFGELSNYHLGKRNFDISYTLTTEKVPRTNASRNLTIFADTQTYTIQAEVFGDTMTQLKDNIQALYALEANKYTITVTDDYKDASGLRQTYRTYTNKGTIDAINVETIESQLKGIVQLSWTPEDPFFSFGAGVENINLSVGGFGFPFGFPFGFGGTDNTITITNSGNITTYPLFTITGGFNDLTITAQNATTSNIRFTYLASVPTGEQIIIDPAPNESIKATRNGLSVVSNTNSNWGALALNPGVNTFVFSASGGIDSSSAAQVDYFSASKGI